MARANQVSKEVSTSELDLKIEEEIKKEYLIFIKKQKKKRAKLDTIIGVEDLKKVEILRATYDAMVIKERDDIHLMLENTASSVKPIFAKSFLTENKEHMDRVGQKNCIDKIIKPMLMADEKLLAIVQNISDKHDLKITEVRYGVLKDYDLFERKKTWIKSKHTKGADGKNYPPPKRSTKSMTFKKDIYVNAWILIMNSK